MAGACCTQSENPNSLNCRGKLEERCTNLQTANRTNRANLQCTLFAFQSIQTAAPISELCRAKRSLLALSSQRLHVVSQRGGGTEAPSCNVEACSAHQTWQTSSNIHTACLSTRGAAHVVNTFTQEHSLLVRPHLVARDCQHTSADGMIRFVTPIYSLL